MLDTASSVEWFLAFLTPVLCCFLFQDPTVRMSAKFTYVTTLSDSSHLISFSVNRSLNQMFSSMLQDVNKLSHPNAL